MTGPSYTLQSLLKEVLSGAAGTAHLLECLNLRYFQDSQNQQLEDICEVMLARINQVIIYRQQATQTPQGIELHAIYSHFIQQYQESASDLLWAGLYAFTEYPETSGRTVGAWLTWLGESDFRQYDIQYQNISLQQWLDILLKV